MGYNYSNFSPEQMAAMQIINHKYWLFFQVNEMMSRIDPRSPDAVHPLHARAAFNQFYLDTLMSLKSRMAEKNVKAPHLPDPKDVEQDDLYEYWKYYIGHLWDYGVLKDDEMNMARLIFASGKATSHGSDGGIPKGGFPEFASNTAVQRGDKR